MLRLAFTHETNTKLMESYVQKYMCYLYIYFKSFKVVVVGCIY